MKFDNDKSIKIGDKVRILAHKVGEKYLDLENGIEFQFSDFDSEYFNKEGVVLDIKKSGTFVVNLFEKDIIIYWPKKYVKKI